MGRARGLARTEVVLLLFRIIIFFLLPAHTFRVKSVKRLLFFYFVFLFLFLLPYYASTFNLESGGSSAVLANENSNDFVVGHNYQSTQNKNNKNECKTWWELQK